MKPIPKYIALLLVIIGFYACASTGMPDGGPYDETPPKFVRATPEPNATNNKRKKISIEFDEYIKLDKASEKVIISPPQNEAPEVKVSGHRVLVEFFDTLRENTTYTIDFGDAIVDNNEDNPLGNFAYAFSTGEHIDTMEVSGTVLSADNLEPVKGIQVGLHKNLEDSAFVKLPFDRISRTDSRGHFTIRGVAPGKYRIYALMDGNQNYLFDSKTEAVAFLDSLVVPDMRPDVRQDTVWNELDTLAYDTIYEVHYTRFLPDNLILRSFKEENPMQYLVKSEREQLNRFSLYFSAKADTLPTIKGLDFDVVYRIGGKNTLSLEFHLSSSVNENQNFLVALQNICQQLPVSHVRIHRQMTEEEKKEWTRERFTKWVLLNNVHGIIQDLEKKFEPLYEQQKLERFLPTRQQQDVVEHMPLGAWDNPYFEALPPEHFALFVPSQSLYVCMQTSESEFDYTLYDSQEHILDGGRLTGNGAWTIWDAMNDLFEELEVDWKDIIILDHDRVKDWIESGGEK